MNQKVVDYFPSDSLKISSYNISSVPQHIDSFYGQCLNSFCVDFDVIGLCETRFNDIIIICIN